MKRRYYLLTSATVLKHGYYCEFDAGTVKHMLERLPRGRPLSLSNIAEQLERIERHGLRDPYKGRRGDYLVQLLKILGLAKFHRKSGRKLLYVLRSN